MIITLILAWILSCFEFDSILIAGVNEICGTNYSTNVYWLIAFFIGAVIAITKIIVKKSNN